MSFTDEQLERYARHIVLKEIGGDGQRKLGEATVAVIGAGGIGSPVIQYLTAAGIGKIILVDDDEVALSNLQRQTIYAIEDIGKPKVEAAQIAATSINTDTDFILYKERIAAHNALDMISSATVVIDGSDNFDTRLAVADAAQQMHIPLISAAVDQFEGQLAVYRGWEADKPCYRCLVGNDPGRPDMSCADRGVLGPLTGVLGSLAALEALRAITRFGQDPSGKLLLFDALGFRFRTVTVPKDHACRCAQ
ncbi:MAG: ThiF family adenylyltransferase [Sphingomonadaceae bacterium]